MDWILLAKILLVSAIACLTLLCMEYVRAKRLAELIVMINKFQLNRQSEVRTGSQILKAQEDMKRINGLLREISMSRNILARLRMYNEALNRANRAYLIYKHYHLHNR